MAKKHADVTLAGPNHQQVDEFERIVKQLDALHSEFAAQAKSKPDNPINTFKVRMLNEKIAVANKLLAGVFKPFDGFTAFDEAAFPTNSDVSFVLTTYMASLERWRSANVAYDRLQHEWLWVTSDDSQLEAAPATRYKPVDK